MPGDGEHCEGDVRRPAGEVDENPEDEMIAGGSDINMYFLCLCNLLRNG